MKKANELFQKKFKQGGLRICFFDKIPGVFMFVTLPLPFEIPEKTKLHPSKFRRICYTSWKFQGQRPRPMEMRHNVFFITLRNCACFSLTPGISTCSFFSNPVNSTSLTPPVWIFSGMTQYSFFQFFCFTT